MLDAERPVGALVSTIEDTGRQALTEMRRLLGALRSDEPEDGAPLLTPPPVLADVPALVDRSPEPDCRSRSPSRARRAMCRSASGGLWTCRRLHLSEDMCRIRRRMPRPNLVATVP